MSRKDVKYDWVDACQKSFEELKDRLCKTREIPISGIRAKSLFQLQNCNFGLKSVINSLDLR